jgi:alkylation response protein AidB-like acyl-CoA dehydrogenase
MLTLAENSAEGLLAAARGLAPLVAAHRAELARGPDLPTPIAHALDAAGLTRLWLPGALGGAELPPADYIRVIEEVARLDGAVGWCAAIVASGARLTFLLPPEVGATMFAGGTGCLHGNGNPAGSAVATKGGWRVSGRWSWGSFSRHSTWTLGMCVVRGTDGSPVHDATGAASMLAAVVPTSELRMHDTWNAAGLRATGSHDFEMVDLFVPAAWTIPMVAFDAEPRLPGPLGAMPFITTFSLGIAPVALGLARAAIEALVALSGDKMPAGAGAKLRDLPSVQADVARAEAELRSARAFVFDAVGELWEAAQRGEARLPGQRAPVRLACWNAMRASKQVVSLMYDAAGGSALDESLRLAACLRDVNAAGLHLAFAQRHLETIGRVLLGMEPGSARF